jgi:N-dimethylarginine dimethylaminohydrolase
LLDHDVVVHHPIPIEPLPGEPAGLGQMFPRDPIMAIGNIMIDGNMRMDLRHKERRGLDVLLEKLAHGGAQITPVPSKEMYLEGGDVIIDLPYVYVGVGKYASNLDGATWLQTQLGKAAKVVPVPLEITGIQHLDCCMTLIGPRSGIIHLDALSQPLPPPLNSYEFITVDAQTRQELGTNVLVLDPETIIVQARHTRLRRQLEKKHFNVIPLKFGWHALIGGAFRCATAPIRRSA